MVIRVLLLGGIKTRWDALLGTTVSKSAVSSSQTWSAGRGTFSSPGALGGRIWCITCVDVAGCATWQRRNFEQESQEFLPDVKSGDSVGQT